MNFDLRSLPQGQLKALCAAAAARGMSPVELLKSRIRDAFWALLKGGSADLNEIRDKIDSEAIHRGIWKRADYDDLEAEILASEMMRRRP